MSATDSHDGRNAEGTFSEGRTPADPMRARAEKAERERDEARLDVEAQIIDKAVLMKQMDAARAAIELIKALPTRWRARSMDFTTPTLPGVLLACADELDARLEEPA